MSENKDGFHWHANATVQKYDEDISPYALEGKEAEFYASCKPYETIVREENVALDEGINEMWTLVCGGGGTAFSTTNARLGVGDGTAAADHAQTGLSGSSKVYKAMDSGYPTYGTLQKATFKASFGAAEGNFAWNEWTVCNSGSDSGKNLNRKVTSLGTKSAGTWSLEITLTLS